MGLVLFLRFRGETMGKGILHIRYFVSLLIALLLLSPVPIWAQNEWVIFRNTQFKFRFIYPPDWQIGKPRGPNVRGKVASPKGKPMANCVIVVRSVPESVMYTQKEINKDIDSGVWTRRDWIDAFSSKFPNITISEAKRIRIDNQPAQFAVSIMPYEVMEEKIYMKSMNFITISPGCFWHFGCSAAGKTVNEAMINFEYWKPVFLKIFSSFVFEK
jgi:hypothetical protein